MLTFLRNDGQGYQELSRDFLENTVTGQPVDQFLERT
jgi:hypothetical protein